MFWILVVGRCLAWCKCFSNGCRFIPLQFRIKETILVVSKCVNSGVSLVICCTGDIVVVVVKISQPPIVMPFKAFILVLGSVSGAVHNIAGFHDAFELLAMVFCTECLMCCGHDHGVQDRIDAKMLRSVLVSLTSIEIHLSSCHARGVFMVDDLLNELHLFISCSGYGVDFDADIFSRASRARMSREKYLVLRMKYTLRIPGNLSWSRRFTLLSRREHMTKAFWCVSWRYLKK